MKRLLYFACFALALAACDKYVPVYTNVDDGNSVVLDLKGSIAGSVDGIDTSWQEDAQISAFVGYSVDQHQLNVTFSASSVEDGVASFATRIKKVEEQASYVAMYPYTKDASYDAVQDTVGFTLPATQTYAVAGVTPGTLPMLAKSADTSLEFSQLCGVFRISLKGEATVNSIEVEALKIAGPCIINAATGVISMKDNATDKITVIFPEETVELNKENAAVFNVVLPPGNYASVLYTIFAEDGSQMTVYDEDVVIGRGAVTDALTTEYVTEGPEEVNPDLSADGYANCYVVTAAGDYSFKTVIPDGKGTMASGAKADWVWATSGAWASQEEASIETMVNTIAYDSEKGVITFKVPSGYTYGNVLIALLDTGGQIVYGWHIWLTSKIGTVTVGGVEVMDRNLGSGGVLDVTATNVTNINNTPGLTYQWGRKDPFPGPRGYLSATETTPFTPGFTSYFVTNSGIKNVKAYPSGTENPWTFANYTHNESASAVIEAGQHPCTNINNSPTGGGASHPGYGLQQWAAESDPCPFGYRVMSTAQMKAIFGTSVNVQVVKSTDNSMVVATVLNNALVIPVAGYRNSGNLQRPSDARIWGLDHTSTNAAHGLWGQIGPSSDGYVNHLKSGAANEIHSAFVRCVKN